MVANSEINETGNILPHLFLVSQLLFQRISYLLALTIILEISLSILKRARGIGNYVHLQICIA